MDRKARGVLIGKKKLSQVWEDEAGLGEAECHPAGQVPDGFHRRDASRLLKTGHLLRRHKKGEGDEVITTAAMQC